MTRDFTKPDQDAELLRTASGAPHWALGNDRHLNRAPLFMPWTRLLKNLVYTAVMGGGTLFGVFVCVMAIKADIECLNKPDVSGPGPLLCMLVMMLTALMAAASVNILGDLQWFRPKDTQESPPRGPKPV